MTTENQGHGQGRRKEGHEGKNGGAADAMREQAKNVQNKVEEASDRFREGFDSARDQAARGYRQAEGIVARNPAPSVLIGFGLGFGVGLALTVLLTQQEEESWAARYVPESLRRFPDTLRRARLPESMRDVPESFQQTFHHLAESIRDLPSAIAHAMPRR